MDIPFRPGLVDNQQQYNSWYAHCAPTDQEPNSLHSRLRLMNQAPPRTTSALLLRYLAPQRALLALLLLLVFARITTTLLQPMIMQRFIDSALTDADLPHLLRLALWLMVTGLAASATSVFSVNPEAPTTREHVCDALCRRGVPARNGNLYDMQYRLDMFHQAKPRFLDHFPHPDYNTCLCPVAEATDDRMIRIEMLEIFDDRQVEAVKAVVCSLDQ